MNRTRRAWLAVLLATPVLVLTACASTPGSEPTTTTSPTAAAPGSTSLTISVLAGADAEPQVWTLSCDPPGGTHPDAAAACAALAALTADGDPFAPVPPATACTEIYGGDQTATVTGTYDGRPVAATYSRTNGCEISRWDAMQPVLVDAGGV